MDRWRNQQEGIDDAVRRVVGSSVMVERMVRVRMVVRLAGMLLFALSVPRLAGIAFAAPPNEIKSMLQYNGLTRHKGIAFVPFIQEWSADLWLAAMWVLTWGLPALGTLAGAMLAWRGSRCIERRILHVRERF